MSVMLNFRALSNGAIPTRSCMLCKCGASCSSYPVAPGAELRALSLASLGAIVAFASEYSEGGDTEIEGFEADGVGVEEEARGVEGDSMVSSDLLCASFESVLIVETGRVDVNGVIEPSRLGSAAKPC